ncbi:DUF1989 domain-containing protein [Klebsiella sp. R390]|uniref:DUF1989 domain-containing protein n=1 Tax=Klebsiella sp. R390 TaxID=2755400 RepID=UPI003DA9BDC0
MTTTTHYPACCDHDNGDALGVNPTATTPISPDGTPVINELYTIPPCCGRAVLLKKGQVIRIINTPGSQVCDTWFFNHADLSEFASMEHTRAFIDKIIPKPGDVLATNHRRAIATLLTDTSPGVHDTMIAACDLYRYSNMGITEYHDSCADNLRMALQAIGLRAREVPQPLNLWMNTPVNPDYTISWLPTVSKAGDYVEIRAELDCVAVMSACPQDIVPINGCSPQEVQFIVMA